MSECDLQPGASTPPSNRSHTSDEAHAAWERRFPGLRNFILGRKDDEPFITKRVLGRGGNGRIYEILLDGIPVALKQVDSRRKAYPEPWFESKILEKISKKRHKHVVELIGSYLHHQRGRDVLGLVLWPRAQFDLEHLLEELDAIAGFSAMLHADDLSNCSHMFSPDEIDSLEDLSVLTSTPRHGSNCITGVGIHLLHQKSLRCLQTLFGCLAEAISYIHNEVEIRHRDLKPSQVLVSDFGVWLTDFGRSEDFSERSTSATDGGEGMTPKYHAPERVAMSDCGRAEDIFALGCTYLEMAYRLYALKPSDFLDSNGSPRFIYCEHLSQIEHWLAPFMEENDSRGRVLGTLIRSMLAYEPQDRPVIRDVLEILTTLFLDKHDFFGPCCRSRNNEHSDPSSKLKMVSASDSVSQSEPEWTWLEAVQEHQSRGIGFRSVADGALVSPPAIDDETQVTEGPLPAREFFQQFESTHAELARNDALPLQPQRLLGQSPRADVHEVNICGTTLAYKRVYYKRGEKRRDKIPNSNRHKHLIEVLGSYEQNQGKVHELGLILWPVADCNLSEYIHQTHTLFDRIRADADDALPRTGHELSIEYDLLWKIRENCSSQRPHAPNGSHELLYEASLSILKTYFGCLASALAYLHKQNIPHRDLSSTNVLLTSTGPRLTGFGLYDGPHRPKQRAASNNVCTALQIRNEGHAHLGKEFFSQDIHSLAWIFLGILEALTGKHRCLMECREHPEAAAYNFYAIPYDGNISTIDKALERLATAECPFISLKESSTIQLAFNEQSIVKSHSEVSGIAQIIRKMLGLVPHSEQLASADDVISALDRFSFESALPLETEFFGQCCRPSISIHDPLNAAVDIDRYGRVTPVAKWLERLQDYYSWRSVLGLICIYVLVELAFYGLPLTYSIWGFLVFLATLGAVISEVSMARFLQWCGRQEYHVEISSIPLRIPKTSRDSTTRSIYLSFEGAVMTVVFGKRWARSRPTTFQSDKPIPLNQTQSEQPGSSLEADFE